jgi:agmatine deiminase
MIRNKIAALRASRSLSDTKAEPSSSELSLQSTLRMPAEWESHQGTWLGWPHELTDWPGKFPPIPWAFAEIVRHLAPVERVFLLVESAAAEMRVRMILEKSGADLEAVDFFRVPTDRGWMRDSGPIAVFNSPDARGLTNQNGTRSVVLLNFAFNGWAKYSDHKKDAQIVTRSVTALKSNRRPRLLLPTHNGRRVVLEGGSIDVNGRGTLLTTEECLLSEIQARNPGFIKDDYAAIFRRYLGITNVLWLNKGIAGDDTHGHVDDLARFVDPNTVVTVVEEDPSEVNYAALHENFELLRGMHDQDGRPLRIETLPMPKPVYFDGQRLPASYANFYIANKIVLVPTFNDPADRLALATLSRLFPAREIVPVYCRDLVLGLGTIHCMTQQLPASE